MLRNDWVNLHGDGHDWLDKPRFPFWMAAISCKIFSITGFALQTPRIPLLAAEPAVPASSPNIYTMMTLAKIAVLICTVALHSTLASFDVRAEPYLTALHRPGAAWRLLSDM